MVDLGSAVLVATSGLFAAWIGLNADWLGAQTGLLDVPDPLGGRKRHSRITPIVGGVAVLLPALLAFALSALAFNAFPSVIANNKAIAIAVASLLLLGLLDDRYGLSPRLRLVAGLIIFGLAVASSADLIITRLSFRFWVTPVELSFGGGAIFTVICLAGLLNAVNMADGKNGLVISLCLIWIGFLSVYAPVWLLLPLAVTASGLLVTLAFNWQSRLFLGDAGAYGLSALIGLLTILVYNLRPDALAAEQIALWFLVPVADCLRLLFVRALRGTSPFAGDRDHLHHHLARHLPWGYGLLLYLVLVAVPGLASIMFPQLTLACLAGSLAAYALTLTVTAFGRAHLPA